MGTRGLFASRFAALQVGAEALSQVGPDAAVGAWPGAWDLVPARSEMRRRHAAAGADSLGELSRDRRVVHAAGAHTQVIEPRLVLQVSHRHDTGARVHEGPAVLP